MKLYHFTSGQHMAMIHIAGITKGVIPWSMNSDGQVGMVAGWQWLTENPDWQQEWARPSPFSKLTFRRDEWRITVEIPSAQVRRLVSWKEVDRTRRPASADFINTFADAHLWHLFKGPIPPDWFAAVDRNPTRHDLVITDQN
jgi:hypothetical protein